MSTFGLNIPTSAAPGADPVAEARRAEELGFDYVSSSDHPCTTHDSFETWTMLSWIAAATTRIKVATRVLGVPYRNVAMVAKMAETFDRLSGGRLILGLGGGYSDEEFRAYGMRVPAPREKVDGLAEAVQIIRGLWSEPSFTFRGRYHHTEAADLEPKPARPIPIWLGTFGPRALAVTGRLADGWIPSYGFAGPEEVTAMRTRLLAAAHEAGRAPEEITCAYNIAIRVQEKAGDEPGTLAGSPAYLIDALRGFERAGFTSFNLSPAGADRAEQVERLGREVVPALR
ncbi:LLM class flavin-dependent oxidoreductase [Nonomuraea endophytica]|uniref:Alkanesulfonate monooxygenase SsuD/methylene tetrahydromethanopterin reductase-like flavin-dependent oxidoreductase (Luciferase family) n=1 Tax=Nonomuraea endophytica TaxID=714136 RepID=A0A7W8A8S7_9ACTN|nr:LLM class flavin-dependent oxidoreductase [Nonomuraea endophytica]MBB5081697.1 alkanesulfonate monooxygenase SsuD/methylene tetrahydromethanopterin reductase-like flavin-dependent oxidoreductase (luciferase family) [Nonomuraea endophytica]